MKRRVRNIVAFAGLGFLVLFSGFVVSKGDIFFEIAKNIDVFTKVYKEIAFNYVDGIKPEEFLRAGIRGMLNSLDPYTVFIDEKKQEDIDLMTNGKYGGIGVTIGLRDDKITIMEILDGYSAERQGLLIGDVIIAVDSVNVSKENYEDVSSYVKGTPGTFVSLKILREGVTDTLTFVLLREEVLVKNVLFAGFYPENSDNVYIKLSGFSRSAADEVKKQITALKAQKEIESVIFDLRGNPGGLLDVAVEISNTFLEKGQLIVSTKGRDSSSLKQYFATKEPLLKDARLVLLINDGSASASEIVAGAIQDHDRGILLGEKSFGKGLVQTISPLSYNTSLKITTAKYFTPSGRCIQRIDYSRNSKVIASTDTLLVSTYTTDKKRKVYSAGGITPDTILVEEDYPAIVKDLLAKGYIFKFANQFYHNPSRPEFDGINNKKLFEDFIVFLRNEKYQFHSDAEKKFDEMLALLNSNKNAQALKDELQHVRNKILDLSANEIEIYKAEIIDELRIELSSRYYGSDGRIKESLRTDKQFNAALSIISDKNKYHGFLQTEKQ